jgi:peptide/nickel transport system permease protein
MIRQILAGKMAYDRQRGLSCEAIVALLIIGTVFLIGIGADWIAAYPHNLPSAKALQPPDAQHWLGTDDLGIDLWAQICHGARVSIFVGLGTALTAGIGGSLLGMLSGYRGGWVDRIIMRVTDLAIALPDLPLMILLGVLLGPDTRNIILVLAILAWTGPARIVRSKVLSLRQEKFIVAAESFGAGFIHLTRRHFLPVLWPIIMISVIRLTGRAIVAEAGLSFLGLGDPTSKSWGLILNHALRFKGIYFTDYWQWWLVAPLVSITLLVMAVSFLARSLESSLKLK